MKAPTFNCLETAGISNPQSFAPPEKRSLNPMSMALRSMPGEARNLIKRLLPRRYDGAARNEPLVRIYSNESPAYDVEIVALVPIAPNIDDACVSKCESLIRRAAAPFRRCRLVFDSTGAAPPRGKPHPYRQKALAKIRQDMVDNYLGEAKWVAWIDADIVDFPANLFAELISRADGGVAAPVLLMEGELGSGFVNSDGFGCGRFYDIAGFVEQLRWARFTEPWFDQPGPVYSLDSVGSCYIVNAEIYQKGARHLPDPFSLDFVRRRRAWTSQTVAMNQKGPANCFTEHYSVCQWAKQHGYPVRAFADLVARHAKV